jgi:hypothetical protein
MTTISECKIAQTVLLSLSEFLISLTQRKQNGWPLPSNPSPGSPYRYKEHSQLTSDAGKGVSKDMVLKPLA